MRLCHVPASDMQNVPRQESRMMREHSGIDRGSRHVAEEKRCAVALTFDFDAEEVWIADDAANERRPGVLSQGTYGAKVAVPLIIELLAQHDLGATFFVPGRVAERHPQRVREIIAAGHEIGLHGYTHRNPSELSRSEEDQELVQSLGILRQLGAQPSGYRSPSWDFSDCDARPAGRARAPLLLQPDG